MASTEKLNCGKLVLAELDLGQIYKFDVDDLGKGKLSIPCVVIYFYRHKIDKCSNFQYIAAFNRKRY